MYSTDAAIALDSGVVGSSRRIAVKRLAFTTTLIVPLSFSLSSVVDEILLHYEASKLFPMAES